MKICPCGNEFHVPEWKIKTGRGKYCSRSCMYAYRIRPSGLKYDVKVENAGWIKLSERRSPNTEFQPGMRNNPEGEFRKGFHVSPSTEFQPGHNYKGGRYMSLYGISHAEWMEIYEAQSGLCAICHRKPERILDTDHDHVTGKVRGLLCGKCNRGLGMFDDDVKFLKEAITYLGGAK